MTSQHCGCAFHHLAMSEKLLSAAQNAGAE